MNRDEIKAVYDRGPDAVIQLVERLFAIINEQQQMIDSLNDRVKVLEAQLKSDSHNSSKPPSSDSFKKKSRSLRQNSDKQSGAQPGHDPTTLRRVETPDRVILHPALECQSCQASLEDVTASDYLARQVFDLPPIKLQVTEHRVEIKLCPECGSCARGEFPPSINSPVQYGEEIKSLALYLMNYQLIPYRRTREIIKDLLGQPLAEGTLQAALRECYEELSESEELIKKAMQEAEVGHFDETGFYVEGKRQWLHVASTQTLTHYQHHLKRGGVATSEIGIQPVFRGIAIHDCFSSYFKYESPHALCNAHHLRELTFLEEELNQEWARAMKGLLIEIKNEVSQASQKGEANLEPDVIKKFEARYEEILKEGYEEEKRLPSFASGKRGKKKQTKAKNLLDRLSKYREETLRYMKDFRVEFDNNLAERDLRMMKVKQKISGCFRSEEGARIFCRIRSYVSTMRKQGHNVLGVLKSVFAGDPIVPALTT